MLLTIVAKLKEYYHSLNIASKEKVTDFFYDCLSCLKCGDLKGSFLNYKIMTHLAKKRTADLEKFFLALINAEDIISNSTFILTSTDSPFSPGLAKVAKKLGFTVHTPNALQGLWTRDYFISTGNEVFFPVYDKKEQFMKKISSHSIIRNNNNLYYSKLEINDHHQSKIVSNLKLFHTKADKLLQVTPLQKSAMEGGNFFCAVNEENEKYFLIGKMS